MTNIYIVVESSLIRVLHNKDVLEFDVFIRENGNGLMLKDKFSISALPPCSPFSSSLSLNLNEFILLAVEYVIDYDSAFMYPTCLLFNPHNCMFMILIINLETCEVYKMKT